MNESDRHPFYATAESLLADSAEQLFAACGHPMFRTEVWDSLAASRLDRAATIGFASRDLRGAVVLGTSERVLSKLHPLRRSGQPLDQDDWLGELCNQLVGRMKNKLHAWGIDISLMMPMTIRGDNLRFRLNDRQVVHVSLTDGHAKAFAWLDALVSPDLALTLQAHEPQAEGNVVLF